MNTDEKEDTGDHVDKDLSSQPKESNLIPLMGPTCAETSQRCWAISEVIEEIGRWRATTRMVVTPDDEETMPTIRVCKSGKLRKYLTRRPNATRWCLPHRLVMGFNNLWATKGVEIVVIYCAQLIFEYPLADSKVIVASQTMVSRFMNKWQDCSACPPEPYIGQALEPDAAYYTIQGPGPIEWAAEVLALIDRTKTELAQTGIVVRSILEDDYLK